VSEECRRSVGGVSEECRRSVGDENRGYAIESRPVAASAAAFTKPTEES
jgi:hypothetical protein